jgi:hypothetical protein
VHYSMLPLVRVLSIVASPRASRHSGPHHFLLSSCGQLHLHRHVCSQSCPRMRACARLRARIHHQDAAVRYSDTTSSPHLRSCQYPLYLTVLACFQLVCYCSPRLLKTANSVRVEDNLSLTFRTNLDQKANLVKSPESFIGRPLHRCGSIRRCRNKLFGRAHVRKEHTDAICAIRCCSLAPSPQSCSQPKGQHHGTLGTTI